MPARTNSGRWLSLLAAVLFSWTSGSVVHADVVLDGSLGASGPLSGPDFAIDAVDGRTIGTNLFHSFGEFNLLSSQSATFTGPASIANVLGRITSGSASSIDGLLRSTIPDANLFLVNPHGILFGPNASLDINGSFHASTGDYIGLADGTQFTALPSAQDALLTLATPTVFGFLDGKPGPIEVDGSDLETSDGSALSFVGGDVTIKDTSLTVPSGQLNLVAVGGAGEARVGSMGVSGVSRFADVTIADSSIDLRGTPGSEFYIRGGEIVIDTPDVLALSFGSEDGRDFRFIGDRITVQHEEQRPPSGTPFAITTVALGTGRGGSISFEADTIRLLNGIGIRANTAGDGPGGDLSFDASKIEARFSTSIFAQTFGASPSGDVTLTADNILIAGDDANRFTGFGTDTLGSGPGGNLTVNAGTIELHTGGNLKNFTDGSGPGGDVFVHAISILMDTGGAVRLTQIGSDAFGTGPAGDVTINVDNLEVRSDAQIIARTFGPERGGDIKIEADSILISADGADVSLTFIGTNSFFSDGDAGDIDIRTSSLELREGGQVVSVSVGPGKGGNINIIADSVLLDGGGKILPPFDEIPPIGPTGFTVIGSSAVLPISGPAGNVDITAGTLTVREGAAIDASTLSSDPGGIVSVQANQIIVETEGRISTESQGSGPGGSITVGAQDLILSTGGKITASSSASGVAGDINISVTDTFQSSGGFISTEAVAGDGGNITLSATNLVHLANSSIATSVQGGAGAGGNISIDPQFVVLNNSNITANAFGGPGGNIRIVAGNFFATPNSVVQASSAQSIAGTVEIDSPETDVAASIAQLPESFLDASALLPQRCAARSNNGQSSFVVAGRGGVPIDPDGYLPSFHAAGLTTLSASADSATATIPETWISANDVALLALVNSGCR